MEKENRQDAIINHGQIFDILDLLSLFIILYASGELLQNVIFGATLFICAFAIQKYLFLQKHRLDPKKRTLFSVLLSIVVLLMFGFTVSLFFIYPSLRSNPDSYVIAALIVLIFARSSYTVSAIKKYAGNPHRRNLYLVLFHAVNTLLQYLLLGLSVSWGFALKISLMSLGYTVIVFLWLFFNRGKRLVLTAEYSLSQVSSYRAYGSMLLFSNVSLYLSMMSYINMLLILPKNDTYFFPAALWLMLVIIIVFVLGRFIKRGALRSFEKNSLFLTAGLLWIFSYLQLNKDFIFYNPSYAFLWSIFQASGLGLMILLSTYIQEDMKLVLELTDDISEAAVKTNRSIIQQTAFLIAGILIFFELSFATFTLEGRIPLDNLNDFKRNYLLLLNFLPLGFVLLSMFFSLVQPVNRDIVRKLKLYREQKLTNSVNPAFEGKLQKLLLKKYRVRVGVKIIALFLKPFLYHKVRNAKYVDLSQGPVVFIVNHREIYGPIISNLYLPFSFRPWIEHKMLEHESISAHIWEGSFKHIKPAWLAKFLLGLVVPLVLWVLNSVEAIPVYRETRQVLKTIGLSVDALAEQDNLLIFPENPLTTENKRYAVSGVSAFHTGFVYVAKAFYRKTGKIITFYPVYANPQKRTITFGEGIAYDPHGTDEPERISGLLVQSMNAIARKHEPKR